MSVLVRSTAGESDAIGRISEVDSMIDDVVEWLRDEGPSQAADLLEDCTIQIHYVDTLFELSGEREYELVDVDIGGRRSVVEDAAGEYAELKEEIESAIRQHSHAIQFHVRTVTWGPRMRQSSVTTPSNTEDEKIFVDPKRITDLKSVSIPMFDFTRLIEMCDELNSAFTSCSYLSVAMLTRAILDHVPPIFNCASFKEVASNYPGARSFKDSMTHLEKSSRKIADLMLHTQIRRKESLPTRTQVNFSNDLDVLLAEVVRITS